MGRQIRLLNWGLIAALALLGSSCGGGGGGGGAAQTGSSPTAAPTPKPDQPVPTVTPLRAGSGLNERTESSNAGSITLRVDETIIVGGQTTSFRVFLTDATGGAVPGEQIQIESGTGLQVLSPQGSVATTGDDGSISGSMQGIAGGRFLLTASVIGVNSRFNGLSVSLTVIVNAPLGTATPTGGPVATPTVLSCQNVRTIIVQTDTTNVSSKTGGKPKITAVVFDSNNLPVPQINVLFDVQPRTASFSELVKATDSNGIAQTQLNIPADSTFGTLAVSAAACGTTGSVDVNIVSGVSTTPVATVILQADPATIGSLSGGTVNLSAAVFDSDNSPINGIDVLFVTTVGKPNPLTDRTKTSGAQSGVASSVLQVPVGAIERNYTITALAGGVSGSTTITVVPGRGTGTGPTQGVEPGEPANITLGASPTRIQVSGTGGTELAAVLGRVFDNNGNPLQGVRVHYHVVAAQSAPGAVVLPVTTPTPSGSPTPAPATLCAADDPVALSDAAGFAVIQLRSGSQPGPVTVAACADTVIDGVPKPLIEQQAVLTITSGPVNRIKLTINRAFIDNNDGSLLTTASAIVTDAQGNTVEDGTPVFFEILTRRVCSGGANDGLQCSSDGDCPGGTCTPDTADPSRNVAISSDSTTNASPPCDTSQFIVQTGLVITPQPGDAITCIKYPIAQQGTEVLVRATVGGVTDNTNGEALTLPGHVGDLEVRISPTTIQVTDTTDGLAIVRAAVSDDLGDPVENVRARFSTSVGTIDRSVLTDANGEADATLTIPAGTASGNASLRVTAGGLQITDIPVPILNTGGSATPTPGSATQPAAIQFVSAQPATIGVRGSGLPEQSTLTFQVTDSLGAPVANALVNFSLARIADEGITPNQAITDENGNAQVILTAGRRALSVQVSAQVNTPSATLITRSTPVSILGGPPSQPNFSLAHQFHNVSGQVTFGLTDQITAFVGDRFGNPVPPGTAVSFTTKGGVIGNQSSTTTLGQAMATLVSQLPIADTGTVVSLATTRGERPFLDANGNGVCDSEDQLLPVSEPYYDANCNRIHDPGEDFIDLNDNGQFDADQGSGTPTCSDQIVVFENICTTFSAQTSVVLLSSDTGPIEAGGSRDFTLIVSDNPDPIGNPGVGNPIVGGSTIAVSTQGSRGRVVGITNFTLPDAFTNDRIIDGINRFQFSVVDNTPDATRDEIGAVVVTVTSAGLPAGGNGSVSVSSPITFLGAPTPTVTPSTTPTPVPTPTATPEPPSIAPTQVALSAGTGAPPNSCNGGTQTFVVTGGAPPFTVAAGGGCASVTSVPASGGSFSFTAGNTIGDFSITVTDALGRAASAGVTVLGPATPTLTETAPPTKTAPPTNTPLPSATSAPTPGAAFIRLDQILDKVTDNQDGTFTTILSALVTDATGAVVNDGIPVEFSLVSPVAGVSVTSPGFTHLAQPCTIDFPVVLQPGDALSCLKYVTALRGTTVMVRARVQTATGSFVEDVREITLIDSRPPATPTPTSVPSVLPTATPTIQLPAIAPSNATLFAGVGAPPNCNGASLSFTVTGGAPPFTLSASGAGCLNTNVVAASGGSVSYTSGNQVGNFVISATDALGRTANANLTQQGPPAAFIGVDLFEDRRADNGDGSFTSIVTALVTDANGATVSDGVPVEFSLVNPVPGVSITSPGFTNQPQPCQAAGLSVTAQPGDALACIKYVSSRQGSTITVRARVTTDTGAVIEAQKTLTLPDTRPTVTPTITSTLPPTSTPTVSPTPSPFPSGVPTFTSVPSPTQSPTPPPGSIQFISATPSSIGVRGSGLPEQSVLTFRVNNTQGKPIVGASVQFALTGTGSETLNPSAAVSDQDGIVTTAVTSGTQAASVRVVATVTGTGISAQSTAVSILGAPPAVNHFSIAPERRNIQGRVTFGLQDAISAFVNDRFGNAVPPGTAVSFVTNAASVVSPTTTDPSGVATATLLTEGVVPPSGVVTVLAFTRGEESFLDNNGNGFFDAGDTVLTDDLDEPFIDFRPLPPGDAACTEPAPSRFCNRRFDASTSFERFVDTNNNGVWDSLLTSGIGQGTHGMWDNDIFVFATTSVTFSGPLVTPVLAGCSSPPCNPFTIANGGSKSFTINVHDDLVNPLVGGSTISVTSSAGTVSGGSITVPDGQSFNQLIPGLTQFTFVVSDADPATTAAPPAPANIVVTVASPNGNGTSILASGTIE